MNALATGRPVVGLNLAHNKILMACRTLGGNPSRARDGASWLALGYPARPWRGGGRPAGSGPGFPARGWGPDARVRGGPLCRPRRLCPRREFCKTVEESLLFVSLMMADHKCQ